MRILILTFLVLITGQINAEEPFYGEWIIKKEIPIVGGIVGLSDEEIEAYLGKKAEYYSDIARFDADVLKTPNYKKKLVSEKEFARNTRGNFGLFGIKTKIITDVTVFADKGPEWLSPGSSFYVKDNDTLIMNIEGVYFELIRDTGWANRGRCALPQDYKAGYVSKKQATMTFPNIINETKCKRQGHTWNKKKNICEHINYACIEDTACTGRWVWEENGGKGTCVNPKTYGKKK